MLKHRGDQDKNYVFTHPHTDNPVNNSFYLSQENTFSQAETKHEGRLRLEKMHLKGDQETIQAPLQMKVFELRRDFLIVSYKSNKYQCELNGIDISDQNVFVKAFFKILLPLLAIEISDGCNLVAFLNLNEDHSFIKSNLEIFFPFTKEIIISCSSINSFS